MSQRVTSACRKALNITATTTAMPLALEGFYVNSTGGGTIVLTDGATAVTGTITPAIGWHSFPYAFNTSTKITVSGTINLTLLGN